MSQINEAANNLKKSLITLKDRKEIPKPLIEINGIGSASIGDFSLIIGQPKSKKTFLFMLITACGLNETGEVFKFNFPPNKNMIVYFDTEQSEYKTQEMMDKLVLLCGSEIEQRLRVVNIREYSVDQRIEIIQEALQQYNKAGLFIIDGARDLVKSINDEKEATYVAGLFLSWSKLKKVHLMTALHANKTKGDENARGHIGTEMQNKAETTIVVSKIDNFKSSVKCKLSRGNTFETFTFALNENILPYTGKELIVAKPRTKREAFDPKSLDNDFINQLLTQVFAKHRQFKYGDIMDSLKDVCTQNSLSMGNGKINKLIAHCVKNGMLVQSAGPTNSTIYKLNS